MPLVYRYTNVYAVHNTKEITLQWRRNCSTYMGQSAIDRHRWANGVLTYKYVTGTWINVEFDERALYFRIFIIKDKLSNVVVNEVQKF